MQAPQQAKPQAATPVEQPKVVDHHVVALRKASITAGALTGVKAERIPVTPVLGELHTITIV